MGALFGGSGPDNSASEARIAQQEKETSVREANQAKELASRRRAGASGVKSKTLFSQVLGTDESIGKQTKLGE